MNMPIQTMEIEGWVLRVREPQGEGPHPMVLMMHGWTGDENVMWVFAQRLPENALLVAPRAIYPASGESGYGWEKERTLPWPSVDDFSPATGALSDLLTPANFPSADLNNLRMVGFSQGAALMYTFGLLYPERVRALAGLAGFLPDGVYPLVRERPLIDKPVFIAHGTRDATVPVERARQSVELLQQAGAEVTYCEDNVGHKLSLTCFKALEKFFSRTD
jgi:phospholipase/carboxylesterase